ncbi:hypothetical protein [Streptomyces sp. NBC_01304]|uniref:hypothetical protein n=1 Tax=Streptomyces sp. NBC_01304 TaxID=2903818 RepID=UPI002E0D2716|nr:hypothetical protein OG430_33715 [Streptomyces sp. NBC_01304]
MIDAQRIAALVKLPSPKGPGRSHNNSTKIVRVLSGLHREPDRAAQPISWSSGLCALQPLEAGENGEPMAAETAARACSICPIRQDCYGAVAASAPAEVQRWRAHAFGGHAPAR